MVDLIVGFPPHHKRNNQNHRAVRFAEIVKVQIVERHEDNEENKVARHELWYTKSESGLMKLAVKEDVLEVRAKVSAGVPFNYSGNDDGDCDDDDDDASAEVNIVCCVGIEHLLTPDCVLGVKACRAGCIRAVLAEQARQGPSARFRWEAIALASLSRTRRAALRAREFGKLHQDST